MFEKAVVLLVIAAVMVQSYVLKDEKDQSDHFDIDTDPLIHDLMELSKQASKTAKATLDSLNNYWDVKYQDAYETATTRITMRVSELTKKIKKLQKEAQSLKIDIKECSHEEEENTHVVKFHKELEACTMDILDKSDALVEKEKKTEQESADTIKRLTADLATCTTEGANCKNNVYAIARADTEIPARIRKTVDEAVPIFLKLIQIADNCIIRATDLFIVEEVKIATTVISCVTEKLHPQSVF